MTNQPPTESNHFKAYYQPWLGFAGLGLGILSTLIALWVMLLEGKFTSAIIVGLLLAIAGFLYLTRPYFVVAPNRLTVYSPIGKVVKRYPFAAFSSIKIESNAVYIEDSAEQMGSSPSAANHREKVKITRWMVKSKDWKTLQYITKS